MEVVEEENPLPKGGMIKAPRQRGGGDGASIEGSGDWGELDPIRKAKR